MVKQKLFKDLQNIILDHNSTIKDALNRFNTTAISTENKGFGIVVDENGICIGVVSDGDIRRRILDGVQIELPVVKVANTDFSFVFLDDDYHKVVKTFDNNHYISNLPVLDRNRKPVDLYQRSNCFLSIFNKNKIVRAKVPVRISYAGGGTDIRQYFDKSPTAVLSSTINKYCTTSAATLVCP